MTAETTKRFTLAEYHRLSALGFLGEDDRVELIRGGIMQMAAKGTAHTALHKRLLRELAKLTGDRATLQSQDPIALPDDSEPEPDLVILENQPDDYLSGHPTPVDVLLLIEISDSSLSYDQSVKLTLYAEAKISDYWIFNLLDSRLEAYSEPYQDAQGNFGYRSKRIVLPNESIALPCFPDLTIDLARVFPIP
jgi:Uma2 family endonuclease